MFVIERIVFQVDCLHAYIRLIACNALLGLPKKPNYYIAVAEENLSFRNVDMNMQ